MRIILNGWGRYDKFIIGGDFNCEERDSVFDGFLNLYNLKNIVKDKTCSKCIQNPSVIDLFLANCNKSFQKNYCTFC